MKAERVRIGDVMIGVVLFAVIFKVYGGSALSQATAATLATVASLGFILSRLIRTD